MKDTFDIQSVRQERDTNLEN